MPLPLYKIRSRLVPPTHPHPTPNNLNDCIVTLHLFFMGMEFRAFMHICPMLPSNTARHSLSSAAPCAVPIRLDSAKKTIGVQ